MPRNFRDTRLDHAEFTLSNETLSTRRLYECLWETLEAILSAEENRLKESPSQQERESETLAPPLAG